MSAVDPLFAQWLQAPADYLVRSDAATAARWGSSAATTERITGIATRTAAESEADRQLAFFARGPFAVDVHQFVGDGWEAELGRIVTVIGHELGYDTGVDVMVLGVESERATGLSTVTVLRPLRGLL
jgi:hypothetical protein